jgi:nodulation protein E
MSHRSVVVSGIGVISSLGPSRRDFWAALREGRSGIGPLTLVDTESLGFHNGAEVSGFAPRDHFEKRHADVMDRFSQFGLVAAREAVADAAVEWTPKLRRYTAVAMGSCVGGQTTLDAGFLDIYSRGKRKVSPLSVPMIMASAAASHICMEMAITGPSFTLATACSSSSHAIGMAFHMVRSGMVEMALAMRRSASET